MGSSFSFRLYQRRLLHYSIKQFIKIQTLEKKSSGDRFSMAAFYKNRADHGAITDLDHTHKSFIACIDVKLLFGGLHCGLTIPN